MKTIVVLLLTISIAIKAASAQSFNKEITEETTTSLQGKINKEGLSGDTYGEWFLKNYDNYKPSKAITSQLQNELEGVTIKAFMGTWCGDSKREVPKFYKLLEDAQFPLDRLTMVGVSRERDTYKQSPGGEEEGLHVARVPTFIFYKDGKEINRWVERPIVSLEKDVLQLLQGEYQSSYQIIAIIGNLIHEMGVVKFQKKNKKIAKQIKSISKHHHELITYSNVLFFANKTQEALAVAKLNILLYPKEADTYVTLANKLYQTNSLNAARTNYEIAWSLDPNNETAKKYLKQLEVTNN